MIKPGEIPQYTGNLELLEKAHGDLKKDAGHIRDTGADVHTHFQGLSAYYKAPEAERLFATTKPVKDRADTFADDLGKVSSALSEYATEIRPLVTKLTQLKTDATQFVNDNKDDDDWEYDEDKVDEHNQLRDDITATVAAFWAAERTCHNKITALFGGTQMVAGDGSKAKNQYGFNADDLKNAKLPWGDPVEEKHHAWEVGHWVKSFVWDGVIVDGVWGTIKGLGTLVGVDGWDAMGKAWKGLAQLGTGLAISAIPGAREAFWGLPDDKLPSWLRDSRNTMKQTGKALVAWDEWGKNPGRAAGAVTFNVVTTVFTGGAGGAASGAGKAGAVAKVLSATGKAGRVIDPMTYVGKGVGAGLSKVGDIAKGLKGIQAIEIPKLPDGTIKLPEGTVRLPDGTVDLPEGAAIPEGAAKLPDGTVKLPDDVPALPEGTTKLPTDPGKPARYYDPDGNFLDEHGNVLDSIDNARKEDPPNTAPATDTNAPDPTNPAKQPALVGAGARTTDNATHIRLGDSLGNDLGDIGRTGDTVPGPSHIGDNLPGSGVGDQLPTGHVGDNLPGGGLGGNHMPGGHAGDHLPGGSAHDLGHGPSASHEPPGGPRDPSSTASHGDSTALNSHADDGVHHGDSHEPNSHGHGDTGTPGGTEPPHGSHSSNHDVPVEPRDPAGHEAQPMARGGETEQRLRDAVKGIPGKKRPKPDVLERALDRLASEPGGQQVAEVISSGKFNQRDNFGEVVSALGARKEAMYRPAADQILFADELVRGGVPAHAIDFEQKVPVGADMDVRIKDESGEIYAYQMKHLNDPIDPINEITRGKYLLQLAKSEAHHQVMLVDGGKGSRAEWMSNGAYDDLMDIHRGGRGPKGEGITFVVRLDDGTLVIPPGSKTDPKDML
ncbi:conserved hypothetical protein [Streptomyces himastatinicus ATCC 53653]|uniref:Uncharacterized protein n=1 Tax=Streptomyces himastatinicus ATCC 53653 TaxID=457427 RepID=D9WBQ8_9ACTN|nr:hypothetical protein [Streptomyces himastatinicus]EFL25014.1 conserved hypothetical protein [Streptomyces himastatinicus ATCC 53653]